jgi:hypothetical protein
MEVALKPKGFDGIFRCGTFSRTHHLKPVAQKGTGHAAVKAQSIILGAIAFLTYACLANVVPENLRGSSHRNDRSSRMDCSGAGFEAIPVMRHCQPYLLVSGNQKAPIGLLFFYLDVVSTVVVNYNSRSRRPLSLMINQQEDPREKCRKPKGERT